MVRSVRRGHEQRKSGRRWEAGWDPIDSGDCALTEMHDRDCSEPMEGGSTLLTAQSWSTTQVSQFEQGERECGWMAMQGETTAAAAG